MFLSFGLLIDVLLMVLGILLCRAMLGRWQSDLTEFRSTKDASTRQVIVAMWVVTAVVLILLINFFLGILRGIVGR
jgi:uncharacterized membrane protein YidH (DUF202 family)